MSDTANEEVFEMLNSYTLSVTNDFARQKQADPELRRIFNFQARQITHVFSQWYSESVSSSMHVERFSELDSQDEVRLMHEKLVKMGGKPPALPDDEAPVARRRLSP